MILARVDRDAALRETLTHALRAPYYAQTLGALATDIRRVADLPRLPILTKDLAIAHRDALLTEPSPPGLGLVSSGTTAADPSRLLWRPFEPSTDESDASTEHILRVISATHGLPAAGAPDNETWIPWVDHRHTLGIIEGLLRDAVRNNTPYTVLTGSSLAIKAFYFWLAHRGLDHRAFGLQGIGTHGYRLSEHWHTLIERAFGVVHIDNYSLSEVIGSAPSCIHCGWNHFYEAPLIDEIVDGHLVLTTLAPWVKRMPLIRYDTGDIVERGPSCPRDGAPSFRFLGRVGRFVNVRIDGQRRWPLAPRWVEDVLESHPEVAHSSNVLTRAGHLPACDIGPPRWVSTYEDGVLELYVEVRFDQVAYPERARELATAIRNELIAVDHELAGCLSTLRLEVLIVPEGSLLPPPDKYA